MNVIAKDIKNTKLELARKFAEELVGDYDTARLILTLSDQVEALTKERDALEENHKECVRCLGEALQDTTNLAVERDDANERAFMSTESHVMTMGRVMKAEAERDEYQQAADTQAMQHKVERDALMSAGKLAMDALVHDTRDRSSVRDLGNVIDAIKALRQAGVQ